MASLRYERRIAATVDAVWDLVRRPESIPNWFPGIVSCTVEGNIRTITTATGLQMPEEILTIDQMIRRFAYRIIAPLYRFHLGVINVIELGPLDSLCVHSTTAEPDPLALIIAGATLGVIQQLAEATVEE
jgi:hypothetical protein